jgi:DNA-binding response OmpR family regulator
MITTSVHPTGPELPGLDVRVIKDARALRRLAADVLPGTSMVVIVVVAKPQLRFAGVESGDGGESARVLDPRQVMERIRALLQRVATGGAGLVDPQPRALQLHTLTLDPGARTAQRANRPLQLTATEFDMLDAFMRCAGRVVSRDELSLAALGRSYRPPDRSVDMHVSNLRRKLAAAGGEAWLIKSVRSRGYLMPPAEPAEGRQPTGNGSTGG